MRKILGAAIGVIASFALTAGARASTYGFGFTGGGASGAIQLTYGAATDPRYSNAFVVTGISGTFSDPKIGIVNAAIGPLEPRNFATPESGNLLAPISFSHFNVASGLEHGFISFDNLFWPAGSPPTATEYPFGGGILDIYGLLFDIGGGRVVNLWSNGGSLTNADYGVAVVTAAAALDYIQGGVAVPEPASLVLLGVGIAGMGAVRRRSRTGAHGDRPAVQLGR